MNSLMNSSIFNNSSISNIPLFRTEMIMAIVEGRGKAKCEIGLAYIDLNSSVLNLAQFRDNASFDALKMKFHVCCPIEVIFPDTFSQNNIMTSNIMQNFPKISFKFVERRFFNESHGRNAVKALACQEYRWMDIELDSKYYSLSAAAALIEYLRSRKNIHYIEKTLKVIYQSSQNTMIIDPTSSRILELLINISDPKSVETLFNTINRTKTKSGSVLLRSNLLQPSTDVELLNSRYDMIESFFKSAETFSSFEKILSDFSLVDLDQLLTNLVQVRITNTTQSVKVSEKKIENILQLKHVVSLIPKFREILKTDSDPTFISYIEQLYDEKFQIILEKIDCVINSQAQFTKGPNMKLEKCFSIRLKESALLDAARSAYSDTIEDIIALVKTYQSGFMLDGVTIYNSNIHGYCMRIKSQGFVLPNVFQKIFSSKNTINFTSKDLQRLNTRINSIVEEIYIQSDKIVTRLITSLLSEISCLYNLVNIVSNIDMMFSFAYLVSESDNKYVRPKFDSFTSIKDGEHPILLRQMISVPNSLFMSEDLNFYVITGPNMSGKTTFLKQTALLQIMAQIGSFVPARSATFRVCDKLFTRMSLNDNLQMNSSSYNLEIMELNYIIHTLTENSLILVDELGREKIDQKMIKLCWSFCERLLSTKAFTLFSTHFQNLTSITSVYLNADNFHFSLETHSDDGYITKYAHKLLPGPNNDLSYGIGLANASGMNESIIKDAKNISNLLFLNDRDDTFLKNDDIIERRLKYRLVSNLVHTISDPLQELNFELIQGIYQNLKDTIYECAVIRA